MMNPTISGFYVAQAERVRDHFTAVEELLATNWQNAGGAYTILGLDNEWMEWAKEYTDTVRLKLETFMETWIAALEDQYDMAATPQQQTIMNKIAALRAQKGALAGTWVNPFQ